MAARTGAETPQRNFRVPHDRWARAGEVLAGQNSDRTKVLNRALERAIATAEDPEWQRIREAAVATGYDNVDDLIDDVMRRWIRRRGLRRN